MEIIYIAGEYAIYRLRAYVYTFKCIIVRCGGFVSENFNTYSMGEK